MIYTERASASWAREKITHNRSHEIQIVLLCQMWFFSNSNFISKLYDHFLLVLWWSHASGRN